MKKYYFGLCTIVLCLALVGCGSKNEVVCTREDAAGNITVTEEITFELDDDDVVTKENGVFTFSHEETAETYCEMLKSAAGEENADLVSCSKKEIIVEDFEKLLDSDEDHVKESGMTKEELITYRKQLGYTCK